MRSVSGVESWSVSEVESWSVSEVELTIRIEDFHTDSILLTQNHRRRIEDFHTDSILLTQNHRRRIERMKKKLKEICEVKQSKTTSLDDDKVWILNLDKIESHTGKILEYEYSKRTELGQSICQFDENTVLYSKLRPYLNKVVLPTEKGFATSELVPLVPKENITRKYLAAFLRSNHFVSLITDKVAGTKMPRVVMKDFFEVEIPVPTLSEQQKIAAELDKIQSAIDNKKQQLALLDEAVKSKFNELIIENGEWKKEKLGEISESILGKMLDKSKHGDEKKFPYLANFNVKWFDFDLSELNEMPFSEKEMEKFQLKIGDILMCEGGEIGRCAVWNNELQNCYFQKALHRIRVNYDFLNPTYLVHWFKLKCDTNSFDDLVGKGATFKHLTGEKLKTIEVPVPPLSLQNRFANFVQQIDKAKSIAKQQIADLQELLDSKMQQYFA